VADRERVLALLHELEQADAEKGALELDLHALLERVRMVRGSTIGVQVTRADFPARRERAAQGLQRARDEVRAARAALAEAEEAVRSAAKAERRTAELFVVRARDRVAIAERRGAEAEADARDVEESLRLLEAFALKLEADGRSLANELRDRPRVAEEAGIEPAPGLDGLLEWADTAHAALFVARGQVTAERDAVVRQANELGSAALGEPLDAVGVTVVKRRVEGSAA
jgi:chromosome segregation ATPase